jgi:hypothetical protein
MIGVLILSLTSVYQHIGHWEQLSWWLMCISILEIERNSIDVYWYTLVSKQVEENSEKLQTTEEYYIYW